jgi:hypothetical protein
MLRKMENDMDLETIKSHLYRLGIKILVGLASVRVSVWTHYARANPSNFSAIASFGGQRELLFKPYNGAGEDVCITVKNGSRCIFGCGVNATWLHGIEPSPGAQDRISRACWGMSLRLPE